jgi:hypothetical protein
VSSSLTTGTSLRLAASGGLRLAGQSSLIKVSYGLAGQLYRDLASQSPLEVKQGEKPSPTRCIIHGDFGRDETAAHPWI